MSELEDLTRKFRIREAIQILESDSVVSKAIEILRQSQKDLESHFQQMKRLGTSEGGDAEEAKRSGGGEAKRSGASHQSPTGTAGWGGAKGGERSETPLRSPAQGSLHPPSLHQGNINFGKVHIQNHEQSKAMKEMTEQKVREMKEKSDRFIAETKARLG